MNDATVKFEIWDIAGQKGYRSLAPMYYRGAAMAIIAYDLTSIDSFARAKKWVLELQKQGNPNMVMALVENKADLEDGRSLMVKVFVPDVMACNTHVEKGDLVAVSIDVEEPGLDGGWTTRITRDEQLKRVEPSKCKKKL